MAFATLPPRSYRTRVRRLWQSYVAMEVVATALRVVLVDDDDDARRALRRLFGACGCTISEFVEGPAALMHLAHHEADLLVTDLEMPGMDGAELVAAVITHGLTLPVVMVSGRSAAVCEQRLEAKGVGEVHAILEKPVSLAEVRSLVAGLVARLAAVTPPHGVRVSADV